MRLKKKRPALSGVTLSGFTLIETLIVLIIIAIVTTIAVLALGRFGGGRRQRAAVSQLQQLFQSAEVQAVLQPAILGVYFTRHGYRIYQWQTNTETSTKDWVPVHDNDLSQPNAFGSTVTLHLKSVDGVTRVAQKTDSPSVSVLPGGGVTPFVLEVKARGTSVVYELHMAPNGDLTTREKTS